MERNKLTTEEFINKAKIIHGDKYNYPLVEYKNNYAKVKIICKEHGIFEQVPNHHLRNHGCPKCKKNRLTTEEFISKAKNIHGEKYDYSLVKYENNHTKVKIICIEHGIFEQTPNHHLSGQTCGTCAGMNALSAIKRHVKILSKIGVEARLNNDNLEVRCYNCKKWHIQTLSNSSNKIKSASGKIGGENNLYCSDECKNSCPVFYHKPNSIDQRSKLYVDKTEQQLARSCQTDTLKQLQCDEKGYNYCERCGDIIDVELHYTHKVSEHGSNAINSSGHILLCAGCHTELHINC